MRVIAYVDIRTGHYMLADLDATSGRNQTVRPDAGAAANTRINTSPVPKSIRERQTTPMDEDIVGDLHETSINHRAVIDVDAFAARAKPVTC